MSTPIRLLIVEGSAAGAEMVLCELRQAGFLPDWQRVENEPDFIAALKHSVDVIIATYSLPGFNVVRALQLLRQRKLNIPLIVFTDSQGEEMAVECLKQGAADYLLKSAVSRLGAVFKSVWEAQQQQRYQWVQASLLSEREAQFRRFTEMVPDVFYRYRLSPTRGFEYISPAVTIRTGYRPEDYYNDPDLYLKIVHPDDRWVLNSCLDRNFSSEIWLLRWIHKNGNIICTETRSIPICDDAGNLIAVEGIVKDITRAKLSEQALQKSEARYRALVEYQNEPVCRFLSDGTITFVNDAYCRYFGKHPSQAIGENFLQLFPPEDYPKIVKQLSWLSVKNPLAVINTFLNFGGKIHCLQWTNRALFDREGVFFEFQAVGREISEITQVHSWENTQAELKNRGEERTQKLEQVNEQLRLEITRRELSEKALRQRFNQLQTVYQLADAVRRSAGIEEIYEAALNGIEYSLRADCAGILVFDADGIGQFKVWRGVASDYRRAIEAYFRWDNCPPMKQSILISNLESLRMSNMLPLRTILLQAGISAVGFIPLNFQGRIIGKIIFGYTTNHNFNQEELQLVQTIASHVAFATERKRSETALRQSEERFRLVFDQAPIGMFLVNYQGKFVKANRALCEMLGYNYAELLELSVADITHPEDREKENPLLQRLLSFELESYQVEKRYITKNQDILWVNITTNLIGKAGGEFLYGVGMVKDITARKRSEEALKYSEEKFRQLAENIRELFWISAVDKNEIIYVSPAYQEIWGRSCESVYEEPLSWFDSIHPEDKPAVIAAMVRDREGYPSQQEFRIVLPDGSIRWICNRSFPIRNELGEVYRVAGIAEDITERKHFIAELHKALETEKELNDLKSRFVSMVSHEFRNPLTTIILSVELLEQYGDRAPEEQKKRYFQRIKIAANQMKDLLENVLVISQSEVGKLNFDPQPFNLQDFCRELVEDCQLIAGKNHQNIFWTISDKLTGGFLAYLDEKLLRHILSNLLSNAIKYSPQGGKVEFTVADEEDRVLFAIKDEGIGIPKEDLPHLFDAFHRANNVGKIPGTGLGLAIVKRAVDLHQGTISVTSEPGLGTEFLVCLPLYNSPIMVN